MTRPAVEPGTVSQNPPYLFNCWSQVAERVRSAHRLALFLDFDGTLVPFRTRPEEVTLSDSTRRVLARLGCHPQVWLFILSGRRRVDLQDRVGVPGLCYLGLHGWEGPKTQGKKRCRALRKGRASAAPQGAPPIHSTVCGQGVGAAGLKPRPSEALNTVFPQPLKPATPKLMVRRLFRRAHQQVELELAGLRGVWIEEKGPIFAVHVRGASPRAARRAGDVVGRVTKAFEPNLRVLPGNKVWEVMPQELGGKGAAVRALLGEMPAGTLPLYMGDDTTDESAFAALVGDGITVCVGPRPTNAKFHLRGPLDVRRCLKRLERELREIRPISTHKPLDYDSALLTLP